MDTQRYYNAIQPRYPELKDKVAIITGSSRGIGKGIAIRLAKEGMKVVLNGVTADRLETSVQELRACGADAIGGPADLGTTEGVDRLINDTMEKYQRVDLLVNNAAILRRTFIDDFDEDSVDASLDANIRGPLVLSIRAVEIMRKLGGGNIINISSVGGIRAHYRGLPYDITKGALDMMTRVMGINLVEHNIRVNSVAPGAIRTEKTPPPDDPKIKAAADRIPARRHGHVLEVGSVVAFLASDDATYIIGQVICVDGGLLAQLTPPGQPV